MSEIFGKLAPKSKARKRSTTDADTLADQVKTLRVDSGLTQEELANEAEVGIAQLRKIEQGKTSVNLNTLLKVVGALKGTIKIHV